MIFSLGLAEAAPFFFAVCLLVTPPKTRNQVYAKTKGNSFRFSHVHKKWNYLTTLPFFIPKHYNSIPFRPGKLTF